jgi:hypothetical protein
MRRTIFWTSLFSLAGYGAYRLAKGRRSKKMGELTIPDQEGNYDIDGVSYDPHARMVDVSGDHRIPSPRTAHAKEVVALHGTESPGARSA